MVGFWTKHCRKIIKHICLSLLYWQLLRRCIVNICNFVERNSVKRFIPLQLIHYKSNIIQFITGKYFGVPNIMTFNCNIMLFFLIKWCLIIQVAYTSKESKINHLINTIVLTLHYNIIFFLLLLIFYMYISYLGQVISECYTKNFQKYNIDIILHNL